MSDALIIQPDTAVGAEMALAAENRRAILFAGLPGVGKSLFLQQQTLLAATAGRQVHLLQWDMARAGFETPAMLADYPEIDSITHPVIRKAVGLWARHAVARWHRDFAGPEHLLIGEVPVVGNRFVELLQKHDDEAEALLAGQATMFFIPVPSEQVRSRIEGKRQASIANPKHAHESRDAPINVLQQIWLEARDAASHLDLVPEGGAVGETAYDPLIYGRIYQHMLQHRHSRILHIDTLYPAIGSVYELDVPSREIAASPEDIAAILKQLKDNHSAASIRQSVENWYRI